MVKQVDLCKKSKFSAFSCEKVLFDSEINSTKNKGNVKEAGSGISAPRNMAVNYRVVLVPAFLSSISHAPSMYIMPRARSYRP